MAGEQGTLLNGRVHYRQFRHGYRTGIEPVLLAAHVPARSGQAVLEAGCGAGAALLCLAHRVPGITGLGVEQDPALVALAAENAAANGWNARLHFVAGAVEHGVAGQFDHAMSNPPWHDPVGTPSPDAGRALAKHAYPGLIGTWVAVIAAAVYPRGTLSLILPPAHLTEALAAMTAAGCGSLEVTPAWPRTGQAARLMLLRGVRHGRAALRLHAGIVLHATDGGYTPAADRILRDGHPLGAGEQIEPP